MTATPTTPLDALGDYSRRRIIELLTDGPRTVSQLQEAFTFSQPALSKHLRILRNAGLVDYDRIGRTHQYRLRGDILHNAASYLLQLHAFWNHKLDALGSTLDAIAAEEGDA